MTGRKRTNDLYFEWLLKKCNGYDLEKLYKRLHDIEFMYPLAKDEEASEYGLYLRDEFRINHKNYVFENLRDGKCTVFELIIALAKICVTRTGGIMIPDRIGNYMELMLDNIGILNFKNMEQSDIDIRITRFMYREYGVNNEYCMFPSSYEDLNEIDILYQMVIWLQDYRSMY